MKDMKKQFYHGPIAGDIEYTPISYTPTKLDYFTAMAMQGLLVNGINYEYDDGSTSALRIAKAQIKALEK